MKLVTKHYCYTEKLGPFKGFDKFGQTVMTDMTANSKVLKTLRYLYFSIYLCSFL